MNKLTFIKGNQTHELIINQYKYIIGNNYNSKYFLIQILREYFSGIKSSEYAINNIGETKILFNENRISLKDSLFFEISPYFQLTNDLKLSAKSLTTKYLETIYNNSLFFDTINTMNILLTSLSDELDTESFIHSEFNSLQAKQLLKLVRPSLIIDNESRNEFDLSYDEIILLQLNMIKYILENNEYSISIVFLSLPSLTDEILKKLNEIKNCMFIIDTIEYKDFMNINDIFLVNSKIIDLADKETLYNIVNNGKQSFHYLIMEEIDMYLNEYFNDLQSEHSRFIKLLLE